MRRIHRSKHRALAALGVAAGAIACSQSAQVTTRTVTLHTPKACAVSGAAFGQYFELGDFDPASPTTGHPIGKVGATLSEIDPSARALVVEATESSRNWAGVAPVPPSGDVNALLLPSLVSCALPASVVGDASAGTTRPGAVVAAIPGDLALVVGGASSNPGDPKPATFALDLTTGILRALQGPDIGAPRSKMTLTPYGTGALVAGGVNLGSGATESTAEKFSGKGFDQKNSIQLSEPRSDHGAVALVGGQTLLVGGVGMDGKTVLGSMDRVDPATDTAQEQGVAVLSMPRRAPQVLRLASGEILVAGGYDAAGNAVGLLEWFSADASHATHTADLVTGSARAYVALGGGGALAVVAPPAGAPTPFANVWVIGASGSTDPATPLADVTNPVLFQGAGGAPVLWTGDPGGRWLRWDPWQAAFVALGVLDHVPANVGPSNASADPGLAMWLDGSSAALALLRFDTRGPYSTLAGPLLATTATDVAPDRLAAPGVATFDAVAGLTLGPGAAAFVTDRTYAALSLSVGAPTGEPAKVVLRDELGAELELGGVGCPAALAKPGRASSLTVRRAGAQVTWSLSTGASGTCPAGVGAQARVSIGVRAPGDVARSVVRDLVVKRLGP